jgi:predicted MPP superfamily phosphohydrolase
MATPPHARGRPERRRGTISRRTLLKAALAGGVGALTGGAAYSFLYARSALQLTEATLPIGDLPAALNGLRVGVLTDVHRSQWVSDEDVAEAVRLMMSARPDLIVLGGDYVTWGDRQYVGPAARALGALSAPQGVFAVLGNHDDDHDMAAALGGQHVQVLKDARTRLSIRNEPLELAGIRFWTKRAGDIRDVIRGARGPVILLAHDPRRLIEAAELKIPAVISGHTHGGQVVLPVVGAIAARKFPILSGSARQGTTSIFVSRGMGTVYVPIRVNCPPEVAILTLVRKESAVAGGLVAPHESAT